MNDTRIKKAELKTIVASGGLNGSGKLRIRGVGGVKTDETDFCIQIEAKNGCKQKFNGSHISLLHNNIEKAKILQKDIYFNQFNFCLPLSDVDIENDKFKLYTQDDDGVSDIGYYTLIK